MSATKEQAHDKIEAGMRPLYCPICGNKIDLGKGQYNEYTPKCTKDGCVLHYATLTFTNIVDAIKAFTPIRPAPGDH